jgi:predicted transcriptional regulator
MASPLTLRLDPKTRQRLERIARRKQLSKSEIVRQAIDAWADRQEPVASPYEVLADLIGVVRGGKAKRSAQTGRNFARLLKKRRSRV